MTDTAPPTPEQVQAAIDALPDEERVRLLGSLPLAVPAPPPGLTAEAVEAAAQDAAGRLPSLIAEKAVEGDDLAFTTGTVTEKYLTVDGERYPCVAKPPGATLAKAMEARSQRQQVGQMLDAMLDLLHACLAGWAEEAYFGRYDGSELRPRDPAGLPIDGVPLLNPIGIDDAMVHAMRLIESYMGRPTEGRAPSGASPDPTPSTAGVPPTAST